MWLALQADLNSTDVAGILTVAGRVRSGDTISAVKARMAVIAQQYVQTDARQLGTEGRLEVTSMQQQITGDVRPQLLVLLGAVALVLLIACARQFWPNSDPVGKTIFIGSGLGPDFEQGVTEIVGVVADERVRLNADSVPIMYQLPAQISDAALKLMNGLQPVAVLVRTRQGVPPLSVSHVVEEELSSLARQPVANIRSMEQVRLDSTARENFNLTLLGFFAAIATLLAAVGLYSVMAYNVEQRRQEIGIRGALGANPYVIRNSILIQALRMSLTGGAIGIVASYWLTPLMRAQLFGVLPSDSMTFAIAPSILIIVTIAAAYIPAARASRVDPVIALRHTLSGLE